MKQDSKNQDINDSKVFFSPDIPVEKLNNAISAYGASGIAPNDILILVDNTVFGSAKDGFFITENYFCSRETAFDKPFIINISNINRIKSHGRKIFINEKKVANFMIPKKETIEKICKLLEVKISNLKCKNTEKCCDKYGSDIDSIQNDDDVTCENKKEINDTSNPVGAIKEYIIENSDKPNIEYYLKRNFFVNLKHHYISTKKTVNIANSIIGFIDKALSTSVDEQNKSFSRDTHAENEARDKQISCVCDMITLAIDLYKCIPDHENHEFTKYLIDEKVTYEFLVLIFSRIIMILRIKINDQEIKEYIMTSINYVFSEKIIKPFAAYKQKRDNKNDLSSLGVSHIKDLENRLVRCVDAYITNMIRDHKFDDLYDQLTGASMWFTGMAVRSENLKIYHPDELNEYFNQRPNDLNKYVNKYFVRIDSQIEDIILKLAQ